MRHSLLKTLLITLASCGLVFVFSAPSHAAINPMISFQGKLTNPDGTNVTDNNYSIRFRIYTDPSADTGSCANTCKWEETQGSVAVASGLFHVNLGSVTALPGSVDFNGNALYLGVKVGSDAEMTPRVRLTAAPYAFNSDTLDGLDSAAFVQLSGGNINLGSGTITSGAVNGVTIGSTIQPSAAGALTVSANGSNALTLTGGAASNWTTTAGLLTIQGAGGVTISTPNVSGASSSISVQGGNSSSGTAGNVSIDTGTTSTGTPTVNVGATNAKAVQIGNNSSNPAVTIASGTGAISIGTGGQNRTIDIGTGAAVQTITIGSTTSSSSLALRSGTGNLSITTQGTGTIGVGNNAVAQTIAVGNSTGATTVSVDCGTGACNFGTTATAHATSVGSTNGASSLTLQAGTGNLSITTQGTGQLNVGANAVAQTITVGNTTGATSLLLQAGTGGLDITTQGTGTLDIGNNAVAQTINLGNGTGATTVSVLCGTGACGFGNNAVAHTTTVGSTTGTAGTVLQAGSSGLSLTSGGNIVLGTSDTTGTLLVLDVKTNAGDPSGVGTGGGMYYNSSNNKFRCHQASRWVDCITGTVAVLTANTGAIANTETQVLGYTIPANSTVAGDTYAITAYYSRAGTTSASPVFRVRVGTTSLSGNIAATLTPTAFATANNGTVTALVTIRTTGASGTVGGGLTDAHSGTTPTASTTTAVAVDTTANKIIELTAISGNAGNSYTFTYATIQRLNK